ncbi:unconventional prefoldin RPB5 interactor-like isoform X3 [Littorina saxatilis]
MVPVGSLAFMPGRLVHTNEVLVLLGDNYFVERSASQAVDIVSRRLQELDTNLSSLQKQRELLMPRTQFTSDLITTEIAGQKEIVEPFDEEKETVWRERHKEYLRQAGQARQKGRAACRENPGKEAGPTDRQVWERLDQLELQESQRNELEGQSLRHTTQRTESRRGAEGYSSSEESTSQEEEEEEEEEGEEPVGQTQRVKVIRFSHTTLPDDSVDRGVGRSESATEDTLASIQSPADVYRLVKASPPSILRTRHSHAGHRHTDPSQFGDGQGKKVTFDPSGGVTFGPSGGTTLKDDAGTKDKADPFHVSTHKAFHDVVVERPTQLISGCHPLLDLTSTAPDGIPEGHNAAASTRPASRFQLARQKKT